MPSVTSSTAVLTMNKEQGYVGQVATLYCTVLYVKHILYVKHKDKLIFVFRFSFFLFSKIEKAN